MSKHHRILLAAWVPEHFPQLLRSEHPECEVIEARTRTLQEEHLGQATICYGMPPLDLMPLAASLRWLQLASAGVSLELCKLLREKDVLVTNLSGLYGPTIAEHTLGLMLMLARNLHIAQGQQREHRWDRELSKSMIDLAGRTVGILGAGNIGQNVARLCQALGMRVLGCRRTAMTTPHIEQMFAPQQLPAMLAEVDFLVVAAPFTPETEGMLGPREFAAMKRGAFYINVSRGPIAQEAALVEALRSGHLRGAGLDVFATEPLPADHPLWPLPQVVITPHYSGETVNQSARPSQLFLQNLKGFLERRPIGHRVNLNLGY